MPPILVDKDTDSSQVHTTATKARQIANYAPFVTDYDPVTNTYTWNVTAVNNAITAITNAVKANDAILIAQGYDVRKAINLGGYYVIQTDSAGRPSLFDIRRVVMKFGTLTQAQIASAIPNFVMEYILSQMTGQFKVATVRQTQT